MCQTETYCVQSLELHLFFARIMKEHALFLRAGFTPVDADFADEADFFKRQFEQLLSRALTLADGRVGADVLDSGELVTKFTAGAERRTERLTGIAIDRALTARAARLCSGERDCGRRLAEQVSALNRAALRLLDGLIALKRRTLRGMDTCRMFTVNYPLLIEHILREAELYRDYLRMLEEDGELSCQSMQEIEAFWNRIMMEHALFIRGLLDPGENALVQGADDFAREYAELLEASCSAQDRALEGDALAVTLRLRDFKAAGAEGILDCEVRSIILPLLADHVLREANHYIRLLRAGRDEAHDGEHSCEHDGDHTCGCDDGKHGGGQGDCKPGCDRCREKSGGRAEEAEPPCEK